jgi:MoaA/NifB/PqqE/SkfB family radical SAM enzyme
MPFSTRHAVNLLKVLSGRPAPIYVQLVLSNSCTLHCRMCNLAQLRQDEPELTLGQIDRLADVLKAMGVGMLVLTGGEPLHHRAIVPAVEAITKRGISVRIQSNGMLFEEALLARLRDAGLHGMTISLHGLSAPTMDAMTHVSGSLDRVLHALCVYSRVFPPGRYLGAINTVVTRANIQEIPKLIRFATAIGLAISLIPIHLSEDEALVAQAGGLRLTFDADEAALLEKYFGEARALRREGHRVYNSDRHLRECVPFLVGTAPSWPCESPLLYFSVSSSGRLLPCVDLPGRHNLLEPGFLASWKSGAIAAEIRAQVSSCRGCMYPCYPDSSYLLHSRSMFVRRVLDYRRLRAPSAPLTMDRIRSLVRELS